MGQLVNGEWVTDRVDAPRDRFERQPTTFRDTVAPGSRFSPAVGRYHLYVSYACPWAHRTLIARHRKGLSHAIAVSVVHPHMEDDGWRFDTSFPGATEDAVHGVRFLRDLYTKARPDFSGRVTVPVLWDRETSSIVNNESRDILHIFDEGFAGVATSDVRLFPPDIAGEVEAMIDANYETINNGVYKAGFAGNQGRYEEAIEVLFSRLDEVDRLLGAQRYLCGDRITAADWCLFTTLLRFDPVYYVHFKCNLSRIADYDNLGPYLRDLYQQEGVRETCFLDHIKQHYYYSHTALNPKRIVPLGPRQDLEAPHGRERLGGR